jgi:hypothetical protein
MEEKDANLWWAAVQDIALKDIRKVCRKYERNERRTNTKFLRWKIYAFI